MTERGLPDPVSGPPLRVLHLFADWKWTGPAEPAVNLCLELRRRGHEAIFACGAPPRPGLTAIVDRARERGLEPVLEFHLDRRPGLLADLQDLRQIRRFVDLRGVRIVHVHLSHDHILGGAAARRARTRPVIVRTNHKAVPLRPHRGNDILFRNLCDGYVTYARAAAEHDAVHFGLSPEQVTVVEGAVDLERFHESPRREAQRAAFGFRPEHVVLGIVARMQRHRRFDVLLEAVRRAAERAPELRVLVVGRGTHRRSVAEEPARRLGLADRVVFAGYRAADYVDVLSALDVKAFLVPGSDGSCRAVREALALGRPVIAAARGMLPEIVEHGATGLVIEDTPETLADAIVRLCRDRELRERMGRAARESARRRFSLAGQAEAIERAYRRLLERRPPIRPLGWLGL